jgi:outer membrane protein
MKSLIKLSAILFVTSLLTAPAFAQSRIATIDLRKSFDNYWRTKQADASLKDQATDMEKEHKGFLDDWNKSKEEYQKLLTSAGDSAVSAEERDKRKAAAEKKLLDIKELEQTIGQYERQARTTLEEKKKRMRDNILKEIREVINAKSKSAGYTLVVDVAGETINNTPVIVFSNGENDITDEVLKQLNAGAPVEAPKTDDKKDTKSDDKKSAPAK